MAFFANILLGKRYISLEFFSAEDREEISFLLLEKKKNELTISQKEIFTSREKLLAEKSKHPTVLVINNGQVLQKETAGTDPNDKKLLHKAFPNLQADEFYYEIWRRESSSVIAICRKIYIEGLLGEIGKNYPIAGVSLGITSLSNLTAFGLPDTVTTNTQVITPYADNLIQNTGLISSADYSINGLSIPNTHLLTFSSALQVLMPGSTTGSITENNQTLLEKFRQNAFFEKGLRLSIIMILALLLANFFLFTYYFDNATAMGQAVSVNRSGIENIAKIKARIDDKEKRLEEFTADNASASSSFLNEVAHLLPSSITLTAMVYNPLEKKIKEGEKVLITDNLATISGHTISNTAFTGWIENIEKMERVKKVTIVSFGKDDENKTAFSIHIELR